MTLVRKVRCQRGHIKVHGKNCIRCQYDWQRMKYRNDPEYRQRKLASSNARAKRRKEAANEQHTGEQA